jgi:hypothetical protein
MLNIKSVCAGLGRNDESQISDIHELRYKRYFFVKKAQTDLRPRHTHTSVDNIIIKELFFYWAPVASAPGSAAAINAYCTSLAFGISRLYHLQEGQWEDRRQWSLGVGQREGTF